MAGRWGRSSTQASVCALYSYNIFGGTRLAGGRESINGSGGSVVLPTVGRNTLRLPDSVNLDVRLSRSFRVWGDRAWLRVAVEGFNVLNHLNYSGVEQRAFLSVGTPVLADRQLPGRRCLQASLIFQDAATVASEGLNTPAFGAYTSAGTSQSRERQVQMGLRLGAPDGDAMRHGAQRLTLPTADSPMRIRRRVGDEGDGGCGLLAAMLPQTGHATRGIHFRFTSGVRYDSWHEAPPQTPSLCSAERSGGRAGSGCWWF